jgi:hypothetical protein
MAQPGKSSQPAASGRMNKMVTTILKTTDRPGMAGCEPYANISVNQMISAL